MEARSLLGPTQLGVATAGGAEASVHSARRYLTSINQTCGIVKIDFSNAFNSISRVAVLRAVQVHLPSLLNYASASYTTESTLQVEDQTLLSREGVQQGDPLGPLLFCLGARCVSHSCISFFNCWYLDDCCLGGTIEEVSHDISMITNQGAEI